MFASARVRMRSMWRASTQQHEQASTMHAHAAGGAPPPLVRMPCRPAENGWRERERFAGGPPRDSRYGGRADRDDGGFGRDRGPPPREPRMGGGDRGYSGAGNGRDDRGRPPREERSYGGAYQGGHGAKRDREDRGYSAGAYEPRGVPRGDYGDRDRDRRSGGGYGGDRDRDAKRGRYDGAPRGSDYGGRERERGHRR
jgi:hypothetical protein